MPLRRKFLSPHVSSRKVNMPSRQDMLISTQRLTMIFFFMFFCFYHNLPSSHHASTAASARKAMTSNAHVLREKRFFSRFSAGLK